MFVCEGVFAQKHEFGVHLNGGMGALMYKPDDGTLSSGLGVGVGLDYNLSLGKRLLLSTGAEMHTFNRKLSGADLSGATDATDATRTNFEFRYALSDYKEQQQLLLLQIPVMFHFLIGKYPEKQCIMFGIGAKIGVPMSFTYKSQATDIHAAGYYLPEGALYDKQTFMGFGDFKTNDQSSSIAAKVSVSASVDLGMRWTLENNNKFFLGVYLDYGLTNLLTDDKGSMIDYNATSPTTYAAKSVLISKNGAAGNPYVKDVKTTAIGVKMAFTFGKKDKNTEQFRDSLKEAEMLRALPSYTTSQEESFKSNAAPQQDTVASQRVSERESFGTTETVVETVLTEEQRQAKQAEIVKNIQLSEAKTNMAKTALQQTEAKLNTATNEAEIHSLLEALETNINKVNAAESELLAAEALDTTTTVAQVDNTVQTDEAAMQVMLAEVELSEAIETVQQSETKLSRAKAAQQKTEEKLKTATDDGAEIQTLYETLAAEIKSVSEAEFELLTANENKRTAETKLVNAKAALQKAEAANMAQQPNATLITEEPLLTHTNNTNTSQNVQTPAKVTPPVSTVKETTEATERRLKAEEAIKKERENADNVRTLQPNKIEPTPPPTQEEIDRERQQRIDAAAARQKQLTELAREEDTKTNKPAAPAPSPKIVVPNRNVKITEEAKRELAAQRNALQNNNQEQEKEIQTVMSFSSDMEALETPISGYSFGQVAPTELRQSKQLQAQAALLKKYPKLTVQIEGYTCNIGTSAVNIDVGRKRALAVKAGLVAQGVEPVRIQKIVSKGEVDPIATNTTDQGRRENRRVVIKVNR
ncbi:hypothetical protein FACS1894201_04670 [Bacteroidia bacterium]|nr:hypothetical protein FACS1894201_04670 [Bacteroidia bacterium]